MRTHISLPEDLVAEIDTLVGARKRSAFIEEAVRWKLINERQRQALDKLLAMPPLEAPEPGNPISWANVEDASKWVRDLRYEDEAARAARRRAAGDELRIADA